MAAKKRKTQKEVMKEVVNEAIYGLKPTIYTGCTAIGVQYNEGAVNAIIAIADGLEENAKALGELAKTLNSSHVKIDALFKS